jgi:RNA polymerase sigma-70 factor (ECF subfamily)
VAALPAEARELLRLRFADGLRFSEIAALQGTTEPAARQRCSRLVRDLRQAAGVPAGGEWAHADHR